MSLPGRFVARASDRKRAVRKHLFEQTNPMRRSTLRTSWLADLTIASMLNYTNFLFRVRLLIATFISSRYDFLEGEDERIFLAT